jgi:peptidoglycan L-alanyl-D-glutamate endopeptidase CwlK
MIAMLELVKRIDTSTLYPPFYAKLQQLLINVQARQAVYYVISGYRSIPEQDALYAKGRTVIGDNPTPANPMGDKVTKAKGGTSNHNFAIAADNCRDADLVKRGLQMDWKDEDYQILAEEAVKIGLESGFYWHSKDPGHVQLPLDKNGITEQMLMDEYNVGGMPAVFAFLDGYPW